MAMRLKLALWTLLPVVVFAMPALSQAAAEPRYTYAELGYLNVDFDDINEDGDGFGIGGSYAFHKNFHLVADYQDIDLSGNADASFFSIGIGGNLPLRPGLDAVGRVRWIHAEIDVGSSNFDDDGYGLDALLRVMINPQLELNGGVIYEDVGNSDDTALAIGGLYEIVPNFALGADLEFSDDVTVLFLKGRLYFNAPRQMR